MANQNPGGNERQTQQKAGQRRGQTAKDDGISRDEDERISKDPDRGPSRTSKDREPSEQRQENDDESSALD